MCELRLPGDPLVDGSIPSRPNSFRTPRRAPLYLNFNFHVAHAAFAKKVGIGPHFPPGEPLECRLECPVISGEAATCVTYRL